MKKMTGLNTGLHLIRHSIDTTYGLFQFPHLTMQVETAASETIAEPEAVLNGNTPTIPPVTTKTVTDFVDHP